MFLYPVFTFLATSMIDKRGVAFSVRLGSALVMIGICVRCLVCLNKYNFFLITYLYDNLIKS